MQSPLLFQNVPSSFVFACWEPCSDNGKRHQCGVELVLGNCFRPDIQIIRYKVNILSRNIAHSITVIPNRSASSFTSLSRVFGVNFATARRCSTLLMPNLLSLGAMCSKEGTHVSKIASNCSTESDFMLLIVEPERVAWNGDGGSAFSTGVDALYRRWLCTTEDRVLLP